MSDVLENISWPKRHPRREKLRQMKPNEAVVGEGSINSSHLSDAMSSVILLHEEAVHLEITPYPSKPFSGLDKNPNAIENTSLGKRVSEDIQSLKCPLLRSVLSEHTSFSGSQEKNRPASQRTPG